MVRSTLWALLSVCVVMAWSLAARADTIYYSSLSPTGGIGTVNTATGVVNQISASPTFFDIAFSANNATLYGIHNGGTQFATINPLNGATTNVGGGTPFINALAVSGGVVYGAGGNTLYTVSGGGVASAVGPMGGFSSAGDLEFVGGRLFLAATSGDLVELDPSTGNVLDSGSTGLGGGLFGLAESGGTLFGLTANGDVYSLDTTTAGGIGSATFLSNSLPNTSFGGATNAVVPEPATMAIFGGLAVAGIVGYRRRKQAAV